MNNLYQKIKEEIKNALRARDQIKLDTLRGVDALCLNEMVALNTNDDLADEKVLAIIKKSTKQRKDSITEFAKGGRNDLAEKEKAELLILESFLPEQMTEEEINGFVEEKIKILKQTGAFDPKMKGKITGIIMKEIGVKADGSMVKKAIDTFFV